ncbi:hypothetical protein [Prochlorococcus marinus]|uniref:hypothetical protein n=1 Tax=Prochlorococcus marinus TaxID=1219 RepID=UPI001FD7FCAE|nr:hypothetical protein [Prochlorococcus marinus]
MNIPLKKNEVFTLSNLNDLFQNANTLIKVAIKEKIAAPFIPIFGIKRKFSIIPIIKESPE